MPLVDFRTHRTGESCRYYIVEIPPKRKIKLQYDYGDHDTMTLALKVRRMDENMKAKAPKIVGDDLADIDEPADKAHLILSFFDTLDLIDQFEDLDDPIKLLHMFRLFLYSVYHGQHTNYTKNSRQFFALFKKLSNIQEQNHTFESKFVGENNMEPEQAVNSTRKVTLFPIPSIVRKRLGLE